MEIFGYRTQVFRRALCIAGYLFSCGALLLLFYWKPEWDVWANCTPCDLEEADIVLLRATDEFQRYKRKKVISLDLQRLLDSEKPEQLFSEDQESVINRAIARPGGKVRYIQVQKIRYVWDVPGKAFVRVGSLEDSNTCYQIHQKFRDGLTRRQRDLRRWVFGGCLLHILNPFYVFQAFTLTLWLAQGYIEYSIAIIILSIISIGLTVYDLRQQSVKLHNLVEEHNKVQVKVWTKPEGGHQSESCHLVPGDVLLLEGQKLSLPCDAILLDGSCVVNEGMLTGESVPVTKTPLPQADNVQPWKKHSLEDHRRHVLFCGTEVIQTRPSGKGPARAVVLQTGFNTAKGDLVRSILYPKPMNFRLYKEAFLFIVGLVIIGLIGLVYAAAVFGSRGVSLEHAVDTFNTKEGPDVSLLGVVPFGRGMFFLPLHSFSSGPLPWGPLCQAMATCHSLLFLEGRIQGDPMDLKMFEGTGWEMQETCSEEKETGETEAFTIVKPGATASQAPSEGMSILHQFPFSSSLLRMSVVTKELGKDTHGLYMKGAPETVASFCHPKTVPSSFQEELKSFTAQGFRVIALAHKVLSLDAEDSLRDLDRDEVESGLTLLGLLVMENRLKGETRPVLEELRDARIRTVMVTGDNLETAVTVGRNSGMIPLGDRVILVEAADPEGPQPASVTWQVMEDMQSCKEKNQDPCISIDGSSTSFHFAMNGKTFQVLQKYFSPLLPKILVNGTVFARMSPGQKSNWWEFLLLLLLKSCGLVLPPLQALKMAHAGISLSEQEASVASPFTSQTPNIQCVPELIREGRASLVSSFAVFKYLTIYGLTQFIGTALLYWQLQIFGNYQYLIQDVCITLVVCLTMSLTEAYPKLAPYRPPGRLLSPSLLLSVFLNVCFTLVVQIFAFLFVRQQPWYSPIRSHRGCPLGNEPFLLGNGTGNATEPEDTVLSYEDTSLWPLVTIYCIIVAFVFSKGKPFRKPIYTNYIFSTFLCIQLGLSLFLFFADIEAIYKGLMLLCTPTIWRIYILIMLLVKFGVSYFVEDAILQNHRLWLWIKALLRFRSSSKYRKLQRQLQRDPSWPPLNQRDFAEDRKGEAYTNPVFENSEGD
uniref:Cation-transporting ATPase n=1 Tax=Anolis carolinensis TaxID=28377 RepID=A0A803SN38_ANOCA